ncbi:Ig-like domain-containing protein [[Clostridium] innocuum]|uniref:Ig-like domain-containing protein n=2 Tax=Clostridium innocuum TaxID=1522 RepID=UPI001899CFD7|nr:Ig-like domain-containing protein [[Clostridium] innocuum]
MEKVVLFAVICCLLFGQTISLNAISTEDCIGSEKNFKYFSLSENDVTVELGKNIQLDVLGEYSQINWRVGNPQIASVDANGKVTAKSIGNTYVYAETANGLEARCIIRVTAKEIKPIGIKLNETDIRVEMGKSVQLKATITPEDASNKKVSWRVGNPQIASVDANGKVTAKSIGNTYVYAETANGLEARCIIRVTAKEIKPTGIRLNETDIRVEMGKSVQLKATITPEDASNKKVSWRVGNLQIASVDVNGKVTAKSIGNTYVYAETANGLEARCIIRVTAKEIKPTGIKLNETDIKMGENFQLKATITPEDASNKKVNWRVGNPQIASVDVNGKVTAKSIGNTYVYAETANGLSTKCMIRSIKDNPGFIIENGKTYYIDSETGAKAKGYKIIQNKKYYFDKETGEMLTGFIKIGNSNYYFLPEGDVVKGIQKIGNRTYCFNPETGVQEFGYRIYNSKKYYFNAMTGIMETGFIKVGTIMYYFLPEGDVAKGIQKIGNSTFCFNPETGVQEFGYKIQDNKRYYFDEELGYAIEGKRTVNPGKDNEATFYFTKIGDVKTGFITIDEKTYYFNESKDNPNTYGVMRFGHQILNGKNYYFNLGSGALLESGIAFSNTVFRYYYFDINENDGLRKGMQDYNGSTYYLHPVYGYAHTQFQYYQGNLYYFNKETGIMEKNKNININTLSFNINSNGIVDINSVMSTTGSVRDRLIIEGLKKIGVTYGRGEGQLDCSLFTEYVYNLLDKNDIKGYSYQQSKYVYENYPHFISQDIDKESQEQLLSNINIGDLIFWNVKECYFSKENVGDNTNCPHNWTSSDGKEFHTHHVGIYMGNGQILEANETAGYVIVQDIIQTEDYFIEFVSPIFN